MRVAECSLRLERVDFGSGLPMKVVQIELDPAGITPDSSAHSYAWLRIKRRFAASNELLPAGL